jgi:hypothetical protein
MGQYLPGVSPSQVPPNPYYVVLDANVWVSERLLQSSIGSAFLYAVAGAKSSIVLPEVVELEVARVLPEMAEGAVGAIRSGLSLLRQLSGHDLVMVTVPSAVAIEEGMQERWKQLSGLLVRVPFTHDQAKSALHRVIQKTPPCGDNNEQFRDCCIWESVMLKAADRTCHLVTADKAFYGNRNTTTGLARPLREEVTGAKRTIHIHFGLKEFLAAMGSSAAAIDKQAIGDAIVEAIVEQAREIATREDNPLMSGETAFTLGAAHRPEIKGYATPKPSLVAISFEVSFDLERASMGDETETLGAVIMTLKGVCSYDPTTKNVSEIEIRAWSKNLNWGAGGGGAIASPDKAAIERQYAAGKTRIIT